MRFQRFAVLILWAKPLFTAALIGHTMIGADPWTQNLLVVLAFVSTVIDWYAAFQLERLSGLRHI